MSTKKVESLGLLQVQIGCWKDSSLIEPVYSRDKVLWLAEQKMLCCVCVKKDEFNSRRIGF